MQKIGSLISKYKTDDSDKYLSREFQKYAYDLAVELDDLRHKSLYMRLAKNTPRGLMESARSFVKDAIHAKSKGRLFMWKLKQLKEKSDKRSLAPFKRSLAPFKRSLAPFNELNVVK